MCIINEQFFLYIRNNFFVNEIKKNHIKLINFYNDDYPSSMKREDNKFFFVF